MSAATRASGGVPSGLEAVGTPEERGLARDGVRLLISGPSGTEHRRFRDLPDLLAPGDLLVVNRSGTLPASMPAAAPFGPFRVSASTQYGPEVWLVEPRWSMERPGPVPLGEGERFDLAGLPARVIATYPGIPRLVFVRVAGDLLARMQEVGEPIRYGYLRHPAPLARYQTVFAREPGSAEMPSAGGPFTLGTLAALEARGIGTAEVTLHAGVSSLSTEDVPRGMVPVFPEPFRVPLATVRAMREARDRGRRIYAVGTTVLRALESSWDGRDVAEAAGFTRTIVSPAQTHRIVDGLLSGLHDQGTSHLLMLDAILGYDRRVGAYEAAESAGYLWHEFGDLHLAVRS